jgi:predicted transcriptional regulator YheO
MDKKARLGVEDWGILRQFEHVVDGLALVLGSSCEVVLHALEDPSKSVIRIANGHITGRAVGSPMTDLGLEIIQDHRASVTDVVGVYRTRSVRGTPMKSTTMLIRNRRGRLIGILCINIDLAVPLVDFARELLATQQSTTEAAIEHFPLNAADLVNSALEEALEEASRRTALSARDKNKLVVAQLYKRGVFGVKGAIDIVAHKMRVSRYTVYNYVRETRVDTAFTQ